MVSGGLKIIFKTGKLFKQDLPSKTTPFLRVKAGNRLVDSKKITIDSIKSQLIWNQSLSIAFKNETQLYIQLLDSDKKIPNFHDQIGACILNLEVLQINHKQNIIGAFYNNSRLAALIQFEIIYQSKVQQKIQAALIQKIVSKQEIFQRQQSIIDQKITLKCKIIDAKITHNTEVMGDMKPYCKLSLKKDKLIQYKTNIMSGNNPRWNQLFIFQDVDDKMVIQLTVWDKQTMKEDDFIGGINIPLKDVIRQQTVISEYVIKYLSGKTQMSAGTVKCQFSII